MMNKLMKKMAVALTVGTIAISATGVVAHAGMDGYWDEENEYVAPEALGYDYNYDVYTVHVNSGYLAVRSTPKWTDDDSNVIEAMYNGQRFTVTDYCGQYVYGYSNRTGNWGYVNADYLY